MKKVCTFVVLAVALSGCTAVKALYKSNESLVASVASTLSTTGCASAAKSLQPGEAQPACDGLNACAAALCPKVVVDGSK